MKGWQQRPHETDKNSVQTANIPNLIQIHNTFSSPKRILYQRPSPCIQRNTTWIRVRSSCRDGRVMERRTALPPADDWQFIVIIFDQGVGEEWKLVPVPRTDLTSGSHGSKLNNTCELVKTKLKLSNFAPFILSHVHHLPHVQAHFLSFHTNSSGMIPIRGQTLSRSQPFLIFFPTNHPIFPPLYHQIHYTKRSYLHTFHITFDRPPISLVLPIYHIQHLQLWDPNTR